MAKSASPLIMWPITPDQLPLGSSWPQVLRKRTSRLLVEWKLTQSLAKKALTLCYTCAPLAEKVDMFCAAWDPVAATLCRCSDNSHRPYLPASRLTAIRALGVQFGSFCDSCSNLPPCCLLALCCAGFYVAASSCLYSSPEADSQQLGSSAL